MTWKDITIEKFDRIKELEGENLGEIDLIASTIAILDGVSVEEVENIPYAVLLLKARQLRFLQSEPVPSLVRTSYVLGGKKYIPTLKPEKITTAQYIDFQVKAADAPEDLAGIISIFLIPEGHKYNEDYTSEEVRDAVYKFMSIEDAIGISAFFFELWKRSIRRLLRETKRQYRQLRRKRNQTETEKELLLTLKNLIKAATELQKLY